MARSSKDVNGVGASSDVVVGGGGGIVVVVVGGGIVVVVVGGGIVVVVVGGGIVVVGGGGGIVVSGVGGGVVVVVVGFGTGFGVVVLVGGFGAVVVVVGFGTGFGVVEGVTHGGGLNGLFTALLFFFFTSFLDLLTSTFRLFLVDCLVCLLFGSAAAAATTVGLNTSPLVFSNSENVPSWFFIFPRMKPPEIHQHTDLLLYCERKSSQNRARTFKSNKNKLVPTTFPLASKSIVSLSTISPYCATCFVCFSST